MSLFVFFVVCGGPGASALVLSSGTKVPESVKVDCIDASRASAGLLLVQGLCSSSIDSEEKKSTVFDLLCSTKVSSSATVAQWVSPGLAVPNDVGSNLGPRSSVLGPRSSVLGPRSSVTCSRREHFFGEAARIFLFKVAEVSSHELWVGGWTIVSVFFGSKSWPSKNVKLVPFSMLLFAATLPAGDAVCVHCKDSIFGCAGGDACPTVVDMALNLGIVRDKKVGSTPKVGNLITQEMAAHFSRPVVDAIVGLACAPAVGSEIDFTAAPYDTSHQAVVQAALYGHCSVSEAASQLALRMEASDDDRDLTKIKGAIDSLKIIGDSVISTSQGVFSFLWAKVSSILDKRGRGLVTLQLESAKAKASALSVTLVRPATEAKFFELVHLFMMIVVAVGLASYSVVAKFLDDVVFGTLRMGEPWKVAHELSLIYLGELDESNVASVTIGTIFRRGGQDTLLTQARRNAAVFFRARGANPQPDGPSDGDATVAPNGKFTPSSKKLCKDFNMGKKCSRLDSKGTCVFNHKCNQFVTDKGAGGVCFGDHARTSGCDYDDAKKCSKPQQ